METVHRDALDTGNDATVKAAASPEKEDGFLEIKSTVLPAEPNVAEANLANDPVQDLPPAKKRKKLKINPGKTSGSRIVFDADGTGVEPLAAMADTGAGW